MLKVSYKSLILSLDQYKKITEVFRMMSNSPHLNSKFKIFNRGVDFIQSFMSNPKMIFIFSAEVIRSKPRFKPNETLNQVSLKYNIYKRKQVFIVGLDRLLLFFLFLFERCIVGISFLETNRVIRGTPVLCFKNFYIKYVFWRMAYLLVALVTLSTTMQLVQK